MDDIFKVPTGGEKCWPRILYPAKLSFKNEEIRTFPHRQKLNVLLDLLYKESFKLKGH